MNKISLRQWVQGIIIVVATLFANIYSIIDNTGETGSVANQFINQNYFFPAGYVFATIWPVIYLGIIAFAIYQALPRNRDDERIQQASAILTLNMIFNAGWVFVFGQQWFVISLVVIVVMLITAFLFYVRLNIGKVSAASRAERIIWVPLAIYCAWLVIATVANVAVVLVTLGWDGFGISYPMWGAIMLIVSVGLGLGLAALLREPVFLGVFLYAYIGVIVRYFSDVQVVGIAAVIGAVVFAAALLYTALPIGGLSLRSAPGS